MAYAADDITDCADGATVALYRDTTRVAEMVTDNYGDFKFDQLEENSGLYRVEISFKDYEQKTVDVDLKTSTYLGTILLQDSEN